MTSEDLLTGILNDLNASSVTEFQGAEDTGRDTVVSGIINYFVHNIETTLYIVIIFSPLVSLG